MCSNNHPTPPIMYMSRGELGTRILANSEEIGLSDSQIKAVIKLACAWRKTYIELVEPVVTFGRAVDVELNRHHPDLARVRQLAAERRRRMDEVENKFFDAWAEIFEVLSKEQYNTLVAVYVREFRNLPHPVMGVDADEPFSVMEVELIRPEPASSAMS